MTDLMEQAIASLRRDVPFEIQDDVARMIMHLTGKDLPAYVLSPEEEAEIEASDAAADRGDFATDDEVCAIWAKHGL